jgi:hypothetical protein
MAMNYGAKWSILADTLRVTPNYTPKILIQVESAGLEDVTRYYNQFVQINGTTVLNATSPRSYRATRLTFSTNSGWAYHSSNGYDVYGNAAGEAAAMLAYLQTFSTYDMLILNTWDEPLNNRSVFQTELKTSFLAKLQDSSVWASRCSYQLIAVKGKGVIYEHIKPRYSANGINTTLYLG